MFQSQRTDEAIETLAFVTCDLPIAVFHRTQNLQVQTQYSGYSILIQKDRKYDSVVSVHIKAKKVSMK